MKINQLATSLICLVAVSAASAQEWVDTGEADDLLSYGVRVGFNTSNATPRSCNPASSSRAAATTTATYSTIRRRQCPTSMNTATH